MAFSWYCVRCRQWSDGTAVVKLSVFWLESGATCFRWRFPLKSRRRKIQLVLTPPTHTSCHRCPASRAPPLRLRWYYCYVCLSLSAILYFKVEWIVLQPLSLCSYFVWALVLSALWSEQGYGAPSGRGGANRIHAANTVGSSSDRLRLVRCPLQDVLVFTAQTQSKMVLDVFQGALQAAVQKRGQNSACT